MQITDVNRIVIFHRGILRNGDHQEAGQQRIGNKAGQYNNNEQVNKQRNGHMSGHRVQAMILLLDQHIPLVSPGVEEAAIEILLDSIRRQPKEEIQAIEHQQTLRHGRDKESELSHQGIICKALRVGNTDEQKSAVSDNQGANHACQQNFPWIYKPLFLGENISQTADCHIEKCIIRCRHIRCHKDDQKNQAKQHGIDVAKQAT